MNIRDLKLLAIAYQCAINYDYCPEASEAKNIQEDYDFAEEYDLIDIKTALNAHNGRRPDELVNQMIPKIDNL